MTTRPAQPHNNLTPRRNDRRDVRDRRSRLYRNRNDLDGAVNDAKDLANSLDGAGAKEVIRLLNDDASKDKIVAAWEGLVNKAQAGDTRSSLLRRTWRPGARAASKDLGTETVIAISNALGNTADGIKHDLKKRQFTELGNYRGFLTRVAEAKDKLAEVRRKRQRLVRKKPQELRRLGKFCRGRPSSFRSNSLQNRRRGA